MSGRVLEVEDSEGPEVPAQQVHGRLRRYAFGMVLLNHLLLLFTLWGQWGHMAVVTAAFLLVTVINIIVVARRFFAERTELARAVLLAANTLAILAYGHWSAWALPAWLYLPFNSLWVDNRVDPRSRTRFLVMVGVTCAVALLDGAPPMLPACFLLLSGITSVISEGRLVLTHEALRGLDRQHRELALAHEQLAVAHHMALEQERLSSLGMLAAGMAHEINNPMSYVKSNVNSLLLDLKAEKALSPELREYVEDVLPATLDGIHRVCAIVADLRRFARGDPEAMTEYDLNHELEAALRISRSRLKSRCEVVLDFGEVPRMFGRPGQIAQVLVNLLVNAAQAMPEGGGQVFVTTRADGAGAVLTVRDTGVGMTPEVRSRLFQPFFTTKPVGEGTGLGLAVVHGIVASHKGSIQVESQPRQGTTFTIRLPRVPPLDVVLPEPLRPSAAPFGRWRT